MKRLVIVVLLLAAVRFPLSAQSPAAARQIVEGSPASRSALAYHAESGLVVVARGRAGTIDLVDLNLGTTRSIPSDLEHPSGIVIAPDGQEAFVIDAMENRGATVSIRQGTIRPVALGETPVDAIYYGDEVFVLCRDSAEIRRIRRNGTWESLPVSRGSSRLRVSRELLYAYDPQEGSIQEISPGQLSVLRSGSTERFASDFEVDGTSGYLVFPRSGRLIVFSLSDLRETGRLNVGAVPIDLALETDRTRLTAGSVAVADPSSKKIWRTERSQSFSEAFARGFARGLLGLGLFAPKSTEFPRGVDRIRVGGGSQAALDSSSGNLYATRGGRSTLVARGMTGVSFDLGSNGDLILATASGVRRIARQSLRTAPPVTAPKRTR